MRNFLKYIAKRIKTYKLKYKDYGLISVFICFMIYHFYIDIYGKKNTKKYTTIIIPALKQNFLYFENNMDGIFYKFKKISKSDYPWVTARVDINRSNDVWENDALNLMKEHGWSKHPTESKSLCKDGSKFILESVDYNETTYQFVSILHDTITEEECKE